MAHKLRLGLSGLAVILGVAFVAGSFIFTDTLNRTFTSIFQATASDVTVDPKPAFEGAITDNTSQSVQTVGVSAALVDKVRAVDGVAKAEGSITQEGVYVVATNGKVVGGHGAPGIGVNWGNDPDLSPLTLTEGRGPQRPGEIALDTTTIKRSKHKLGDTVTVLTPGPKVTAKLVGIFRFGESGGLAGATLTAFDTPTAQQLLLGPGRFSQVDVAAASGVSQTQLKQRVAAAVGPTFRVRTRDEQTAAETKALKQGLSFLNYFLLGFAFVALFVGAFLILNTFSMLVAQRSRELALLRALGASRRQVTRSVLGEAAVTGLVGSTLGLGLGFAIAALLRALFGAFGLTIDGRLVFYPATAVWAYAVGVLITLVAAYLPARRASRVPPVAAMRDDVAMPERSLHARAIVGSVLLALTIALWLFGDTRQSAGSKASLVGIACLALLVALIALSPVIGRVAVHVLGAALPRIAGTTGRLARENAVRNPRRTAVTASALMIGLALVTGFSVMSASIGKSIDRLVDKALGADFVVSTSVGQGFSPTIGNQVAAIPGVDSVVRQRMAVFRIGKDTKMWTAMGGGSLDKSVKVDMVSGQQSALQGDKVLIDKTTATNERWTVGSTFQGLFPNGKRGTFTIGGIYKDNPVLAGGVIDLAQFESLGGAKLDNYVYVALAGGADAAAVHRQINRIVAANPVVTVKDQSQFKKEQRAGIDQLLTMIYALLALTILIAVLGIVNTLALSVVERTREIGLLRAVGMARRQLRRMIRLEAVVISVYGAGLGVVAGMAMGLTLTRALLSGSQGVEVLSVPVVRLVVFVLAAAAIGVLAAVWPARRAARLDVLRAVTTD